MERLVSKIGIIVLIAILSILIIPGNAFATNENIQIVKTDENYIVYPKDMISSEFKYATNDDGELDFEDVGLNYINSVVDGDGNNVAILNGQEKFIYLKQGSNTKVVELNFAGAIEKIEVAEVEETTNRIETEILTNLEERNEEIDGVRYTETVGGLKIADDQDASYEYVSVKLPAEGYTALQELAEKLNTEYEGKDMYSKIEFAKEFITLYKNLINSANDNQTWKPVENMTIKQPSDAQNGDKYVVLLKKVKDGNIEYDAKFMTSYREDEEEVIPARTETKVVQETAKLPITGESLAIFAVLAVIVIALIIVYVRMKKLQNKGKH